MTSFLTRTGIFLLRTALFISSPLSCRTQAITCAWPLTRQAPSAREWICKFMVSALCVYCKKKKYWNQYSVILRCQGVLFAVNSFSNLVGSGLQLAFYGFWHSDIVIISICVSLRFKRHSYGLWVCSLCYKCQNDCGGEQVWSWFNRSVWIHSNHCSCYFFKSQSSVPPSIAEGPTNVTVTVNIQTTLSCEATGIPKPTVTWTKDARPLNTDQNQNMYRFSQVFFLFYCLFQKSTCAWFANYYL